MSDDLAGRLRALAADCGSWEFGPDGGVVVDHAADPRWWTALDAGRVHCSLCYRDCTIGPGAGGWCKLRRNDGGRLTIPEHGVVSCVVRQQSGYQVDPFLSFRPGELTLFLGTIRCTSSCVFCMSKEIVWEPERVPWLGGTVGNVAHDGGQYHARSYLHPLSAIAAATQWGCTRILFGISEATLTIEYTLDVARMATAAGLTVAIESNGFTSPDAIAALTPHVDAVDIGVKGSAAPEFYRRWMRSEGAVPHVLAALKAWRAAEGVHLIVGDLIPPRHMQPDDAAEEAQRRFYAWVAEALGPLTPTLITTMATPGPARPDLPERHQGYLLPADATEADVAAYTDRWLKALDLARAAGLAYAHSKRDDEIVRCHACDQIILRFRSPMLSCTPCTMATHACHFWRHEQHATGGKCDWCGSAVPIKTLAIPDLLATRDRVLPRSMAAVSVRRRMA